MSNNVRIIVACIVLSLVGCAQVPQRDYYSYLQYSSKAAPRKNTAFRAKNNNLLSADERALYQKELALREATIQQLRQDLESSRAYIHSLLTQLAHLNKVYETNVTGIKNLASDATIPHSIQHHESPVLCNRTVSSTKNTIDIDPLRYNMPASHDISLYKTSIAVVAYGIAHALGIQTSSAQTPHNTYAARQNTVVYRHPSTSPPFTLTATSTSTPTKESAFELEFPEVIYDEYSEIENTKEDNHAAKPAIYTRSVRLLPEEKTSRENSDAPFAVSNAPAAQQSTQKKAVPADTQQYSNRTPPKPDTPKVQNTPKTNTVVNKEESKKLPVQQQSIPYTATQRVNAYTTMPSSQRSTPKNLYDAALSATYSHQYERSRALFQQFLREFPTDPLTPNALYWVGETWYSIGNYTKAIEHFQNVMRRFPNNPKAPDALLKIAMSYNRLKHTKRAQETLIQLKKQYPQSSALKKAYSLRLL